MLISGKSGTMLPGTVIGTMILGTTTNGLRLLQQGPFVQQMIQGGVLVVALVAYARLGRR